MHLVPLAIALRALPLAVQRSASATNNLSLTLRIAENRLQ
jgi:hypothetical protein